MADDSYSGSDRAGGAHECEESRDWFERLSQTRHCTFDFPESPSEPRYLISDSLRALQIQRKDLDLMGWPHGFHLYCPSSLN